MGSRRPRSAGARTLATTLARVGAVRAPPSPQPVGPARPTTPRAGVLMTTHGHPTQAEAVTAPPPLMPIGSDASRAGVPDHAPSRRTHRTRTAPPAAMERPRYAPLAPGRAPRTSLVMDLTRHTLMKDRTSMPLGAPQALPPSTVATFLAPVRFAASGEQPPSTPAAVTRVGHPRDLRPMPCPLPSRTRARHMLRPFVSWNGSGAAARSSGAQSRLSQPYARPRRQMGCLRREALSPRSGSRTMSPLPVTGAARQLIMCSVHRHNPAPTAGCRALLGTTWSGMKCS